MMRFKKPFLTAILTLCTLLQLFAFKKPANAGPDIVYLFAYATSKDKGHQGLHFAWSNDKKNWHAIGPEHTYLRSDYGRWGSQKRMLKPFLFKAQDGMWHAVWTLNETDGAFGHAASNDLVSWKRQIYPIVMPAGGTVMQPEITEKSGVFTITWLSSTDNKAYSNTTKDFKTYTATKPASSQGKLRESFTVSGITETGTIHTVTWEEVEKLITAHRVSVFKNQQNGESSKDDATRFAGLKPVQGTVTLKPAESKKISDMLMGVFFEDINYAADGGLYAELVQNRDFEYALSDKEGQDKNWNTYTAWSQNNSTDLFTIDSINPIHKNNRHYAVLNTDDALVNSGFDGIALKAGDKYDISLFARTIKGNTSAVKVRLIGINGEVYGEASVKGISSVWKKLSAVITASRTITDARLEVAPQTTGSVAVDMISLFPQKTFKNRKNGLRADLAQTVTNLKPKFVRFPGGCVAHGDGLENIYNWKNSVGPLESRLPMRNLWGYHQTLGLGYFEYFQFCEDMGAAPLPVIAAGVPCQNSAIAHGLGGGQQCGVPMEDMDEYIQDILDLVEYANGDAKTKWGKVRADAGHPKPFNLKYIGIGNEDLITDIFEERYTMIVKALKAKYPNIIIIGTVGPSAEGTDYEEGWNLADKLNIDMVDEHYYQPVGWFIHNQDFYDKYDRSKSKVYLGEYAAHLPGRPNNIETALAEALYLTALERNGDIVTMTSYAPMLAKENHTQWNPDLIYFNNTEVKPTVGYYIQQLFGQNAGETYIPSDVTLTDAKTDVSKRVAVSVVRDTKTKDLILKIVNLLPVATTLQINLDGAGSFAPTATRTVLTGAPDSKTAKPVTDTVKTGKTLPCEVQPYSFTLIRLKNK